MISDIEKMDLFIGGNWDPIEKIIREEIAQKMERKAEETYYDEKEIWLEAAVIARGKDDK